MRVCLGQINTTPGDFAGNLSAIKRGIVAASEGNCDIVLFPELSIPGYLGQDLLYHPAYIDKNLAALDEIIAMTAGNQRLHVIVGYIERNRGPGKPFFNRAAVVHNGSVLGRYSKQLIPFYDVFDELRYFEPGTELLLVDIAGKRVGITICEDLWNDKGADDYNYEDNPLQQYRDANCEIVLSLNSSPYVHEKGWQRLRVISPGSEGLSIVYVNQIGGQDELVFDGQSFVVRDGGLVHLSSGVIEDSFAIVDLESALVEVPNVFEPVHRKALRSRWVSLYDLLVLGLRDYTRKSGFSQIVLASSGGVDSAVVCKLACDAVGATNVHAIRMPSIYSSDHSRDDAIALHKNLGCWDYEVEVNHTPVVQMLNQRYERYLDSESNSGKNAGNLVSDVLKSNRYANVADENIQARLRDVNIMHFSNAYGAMPLSTGNKTESACGYYTHFDMNFSYAPIKDLYKFQVVGIASAAKEIPDNIWQKAPSAELAPGQTDEASLLSYAILDPIVRAYVEEYISTFATFERWVLSMNKDEEVISLAPDKLIAWLGSERAESDFRRIVSLIGRMEYKRRQTCPGTKVSKVAFGIGRRIPIVEKWS